MIRLSLYFITAFCFVGCGFVHDEEIVGPYRLIAVDTDSQMNVSYDSGDGSAIGRIPETVFSIGYNQKYIVAKQHPNNNRAVTNFFYLDTSKDCVYANPEDSVVGPLTDHEFSVVSVKLGLPEFSRTIAHLE